MFLVHLGFAYQQLERYADAAKAFARAAAEGGPPDANLLSFHAEALYLAKQKDEALAAVRKARERFPDDVDLTGLEATLLREKGDEAAGTALVRGINVTRTDVLYELADAAGLDVARFAGALCAPATERRVLSAYLEALEKGVERAPALVIADEWLVAGPRAAKEYRTILRRYATARMGFPPTRTVH